MNDTQFNDFLGLMMCSDPWPESVAREALEQLADEESRKRGYDDWIDAIHKFQRPVENHPYSGSF